MHLVGKRSMSSPASRLVRDDVALGAASESASAERPDQAPAVNTRPAQKTTQPGPQTPLQLSPSAVIDLLPEAPRLWTEMILDAEDGRFTPPLIEEHDFGILRNCGDLYVSQQLTPGEELCVSPVRGRILELGAGFGRVSDYLRQRGQSVVTTDADPEIVAMYQSRGWTDSCEIALPNFPQGLGKFDAVIALRGVLSLSGEIDAVYQSLARIRDLLNPGGRLIFSSSRVSSLLSFPGRSPLEYRVRFIYRSHRSLWLSCTAVPEWLAIPFLRGLGFVNLQIVDPATTDGAGYFVMAQLNDRARD